MSKIITYLGFGGKCREAMNFYKDCIGGELELQTVGESGAKGMMPEEFNDQIIHSSLTKGNITIFATDMTRGKMINGNDMSLCVVCDTEEETRGYFEKLSVGGHISDPLNITFWGALFGGLTDKYGKQWIFDCENVKK
jgi:PhnB protein